MQINLPSAEQIYDLSTQQLIKLKDQLKIQINNFKSKQKQKNIKQNKKIQNGNFNDNQLISDQKQNMQQFLENIQLQIEQRKTIQYFTQLCLNDGTTNKYLQQITNFNNQFKKLANQLIENKSELNKQEEIQQQKNVLTHARISQTSLNSNISENSTKYSKENQDFSTKTIQSQTNDHFNNTKSTDIIKQTQISTKKMGLGAGNMKKNKNKLQDFIKATLNKTKAVQYVSGKGGLIKKSPQRVPSNNSNVYSQSTTTPITTNKSINLPNQQLKNNHNKNKIQSKTNIISSNSNNSSKNIPTSKKSIQSNRQTQTQKRNQIIQKMKSTKKSQSASRQANPPSIKKKASKQMGLDSKSLVQMVKQQQQAKKKRQQQPVQRKQKQKQKTIEQIQNVNTKSLKQIQSNKIQKQFNKNQSIQIKQKFRLDKNNQESKQNINKQIKQVIKQQQKQFPIKQQINPILSSSDNQSDGQNINKKFQNKIKNKNNQNKQRKFNSIPQEEIQQSILILKQENQKYIQQKINQKLQQSNTQKGKQKKQQKKKQQKNISKIQIKQQQNQPQNQTNKNKQIMDKKFQNKNQNKVQKPQNNYKSEQKFGSIIIEDYNPNTHYDEQTHTQNQNKQNYTTKNQNNIDINDEQNDNNQNISQQQKQNQIHSLPNNQQQNKKTNNKVSIEKTSNNNQKTKKSKNISKKNLKKQNEDLIKLPQTQQLSNKMYNQQYWLHIKQQAQAKIQRFKQQKQLQKKQRQLKYKILQEQKRKLKQQLIKKGIKNQENQIIPNQTTQISQLNEKQEQNQKRIIQILQDNNDKFIKQQKQNLQKILSQNNPNGSKKIVKKPTPSIIKQPKVVYPKPEFNYLQIFPTFNHIFNVYHTKSHNQALLDIPLVMKELICMFTDHLTFLKNRNNIFRPAIFLPFDNKKSNYFSDARQLLQHAQTTYVNLKTLVQRIQIFNQNIQGAFQNSSEQQKINTQYYRVVKTKEEVYDIITTSFLRRKGWKQLSHGQNLKANWNLFWSWSKPQIDMNKILTLQKVNHFPFNKNLSRKDLLYKNIEYFRKTHKVSFPYLPLTFNLPKQFTQFSKRFHEQQLINREKNYWIMKPIGKSRGRGIKLINSLGDLNYLDNIVVQKYIANPLLIQGYKFDMRIYVLVTSFHPLQAFVYRQGFARLSTEKYSLQPGDMKNNFVHLTNFAINRHNSQAVEQFSGGSKISLKSLKQKITKMGYSFISVWSQVHEIIIKSLLACSVSVPPFPGAFQLFGYDIMLDTEGQCHLIEINSSPSLQRSYLIDQVIKQSLIDDIVQIVNPPNFSKQEIINVMNERLSPQFRNTKKTTIKQSEIQQQDLIHLARILKYQKLRKFGQIPDKMGLFQMVSPCQMSKDLEKLIKCKSGINNPHNID